MVRTPDRMRPKRVVGLVLATLLASGEGAAAQSNFAASAQDANGAHSGNRGGVFAPAAYDTVHADLAIEFRPEARQLLGRATLSLRPHAATDRILLDLDSRLVVSRVLSGGVALPPTRWVRGGSKLTILTGRRIAKGQFVTIGVDYSGKPLEATRPPWEDGIVWKKAGGRPWFGTTAQFSGCAIYWPCVNDPAARVGVVDAHVTVPASLVAPGNGIFRGKTILPGNRVTWHWRAFEISPSLVAFQAGPFGVASSTYQSAYGNRFPLNFWFLPSNRDKASNLFKQFGPYLDFLERTVGPFPFANQKMGVVDVPYLGMEHQTINGYGGEYPGGGKDFDWLLQHELSHEWFGNQVTVRDYDDFWIHEGYAQYMQPLYVRWAQGEQPFRAMMEDYRKMILNRHPLVSGHPRTAAQYDDAAGGPGIDVCVKAALMLHTLRSVIGDAHFFAIMRELVYGRNDPRPGNFRPRFASTAEYEDVVRRITGTDMRWFFDVYLRSIQLPRLVEARNADTVTLKWIAPGNQPFPLPVTVSIGGRLQTVAMTDGHGSFTLAAGDTYLVDPMSDLLREK